MWLLRRIHENNEEDLTQKEEEKEGEKERRRKGGRGERQNDLIYDLRYFQILNITLTKRIQWHV